MRVSSVSSCQHSQSAIATGSSIVSGQGTLAASPPERHVDSANIKGITLPNEIWVLILQKIKSDKDVVELSTTCQQVRAIYQDNWVRRPDQRQFQALVYQLTTPALHEALYHKVVNRMLDKIVLPIPYTEKWKQLRDTLPHSKLRGEARHAALIQKMVIISWEGLLQPEVLANRALASQLMRLLIDLSPHLHYAEEYVAKLFHHGLEWETFEQLADVHLDRCIQLVAKYFPIEEGTLAYEFTDKQVGKVETPDQLLLALKSGSDQSVLGYAVGSMNEDLLDILLKRGCDLEQRNFYGQTPLLQAAYIGDPSILRPLLQHKANYFIKDKQNNTFLMALCTGDVKSEVVEWLLEKTDIDVNEHNINGETALHNAARYGYPNRTKALLNHPQLNINIRTVKGESAVDYAIQHSSFAPLQILLQQEKLDPTLTQNPDVTALYAAIEHNRLTAIQQLLPSATIKYQARLAAFNYAIWQERDEIADAFLQNMDEHEQRTFIIKASDLARKNYRRDIEEKLYKKYGEQHSMILLPAREKPLEHGWSVEFQEVQKTIDLLKAEYLSAHP
jgi:ankyrin repeat protein